MERENRINLDEIQCETDEGFAHPALRESQEVAEQTEERDGNLLRLQRMLFNMRVTEGLYKASPTGFHRHTIEIDENNRSYLFIDKQFLKGQRKALLTAWEDVATPLEKVDGEWVQQNDELGHTMANEVVYEVKQQFEPTE